MLLNAVFVTISSFLLSLSWYQKEWMYVWMKERIEIWWLEMIANTNVFAVFTVMVKWVAGFSCSKIISRFVMSLEYLYWKQPWSYGNGIWRDHKAHSVSGPFGIFFSLIPQWASLPLIVFIKLCLFYWDSINASSFHVIYVVICQCLSLSV